MSAETSLEGTITSALQSAKWFVLIATPAAAASQWVNKEIEWWLAHKDPRRILIAHADGELAWVDSAGERALAGSVPGSERALAHSTGEWASTGARDLVLAGGDFTTSSAVPPALRGRLPAQPRWVDLTWFDDPDSSGKDDPRFNQAVQELAAPILGVPRDEIGGIAAEQHRRTMRIARGAIVILASLLVLAIVAGGLALYQRGLARAELRNRVAASLAAQAINLQHEDPRLAALSALQSYRLTPDDRSVDALTAVATANRSVEFASPAHSSSVDAVVDLGGDWDYLPSPYYIASHAGGPQVVLRDLATLAELDARDLPAPATRIGGFKTTSRHFVIAEAGGGWYAMEAKDLKLQEPKGLPGAPAGNDVVWAGRVPTQGQAHFVLVTSTGEVMGWNEDLQVRQFPPIKRPAGAGAHLVVGLDANQDKGLIAAFARDDGSGVDLAQYTFASSAGPGGTVELGFAPFAGVTAVAGRQTTSEPDEILLGTGNGVAALTRKTLAVRAFPAGGATGRVRALTGIDAMGGASKDYIVATDTGTTLLSTDYTRQAPTVGQIASSVVATEDRYVAGHADGSLSVIAAGGDLRTVFEAGRTSQDAVSAFAPDGAIVTTVPAASRDGNGVSTEVPAWSSGVLVTSAIPRSDDPSGQNRDQIKFYPLGNFSAQFLDLQASSQWIAAVGKIPDGRGVLVVWNRTSGAVTLGGLTNGQGAATGVAISPDETRVALTEIDQGMGRVQVMGITDKSISNISDVSGAAKLGGFAQDGSVFAYIDDFRGTRQSGLVRLPVAGEAEFVPQQGSAASFAVSLDGTRYVLADGTSLLVREVGSNRTLQSRVLGRNVDRAWWSPAGDQLMVQARDRGLLLLDAASLTQRAPTIAVDGPTANYSVSWWDPEQHRGAQYGNPQALVAVGVPGKSGITALTVSDIDWSKRMCAVAGSTFNTAEWQQFIGSVEPEHDLCAGARSVSTSSPSPLPKKTPESCIPSEAVVRELTGHPEFVVTGGRCSTVDPNWAVVEAKMAYQSESNDTRLARIYFQRVDGKWVRAQSDNGFHSGGWCELYRTRPDVPSDFKAELKAICGD